MSLLVDKLSTNLLPEISFAVEAGECVCIHGPSGAGKTLLLRAIADLDPSQGRLLLDQQSRQAYSPTQWRRAVTYLPAESHWWSTHVADHFLRDDTEFAALGLPTEVIGWEITRLSSGERQRLALLRALDHAPQVLLLDEVTANLDEDNTRLVEKLIDAHRQQGLAVVWVSHDTAQRQRVATRRYLITDGKFRAED